MDTVEFRCLITREFPQLRAELEYWEDDLWHLQMGEFQRFTQKAIEACSFDMVRKAFEIATSALRSGDDALLNAIYVSFLEHLDFRSDAGKEALLLMPAELRKARYRVLDYDEKILGRKLDNRHYTHRRVASVNAYCVNYCRAHRTTAESSYGMASGYR